MLLKSKALLQLLMRHHRLYNYPQYLLINHQVKTNNILIAQIDLSPKISIMEMLNFMIMIIMPHINKKINK